jgi:hypothetical protein
VRFKLSIELGNEEMQTYYHVRRALEATYVKIAHDYDGLPKAGDGGKIRDINGNTVGSWEMVE